MNNIIEIWDKDSNWKNMQKVSDFFIFYFFENRREDELNVQLKNQIRPNNASGVALIWTLWFFPLFQQTFKSLSTFLLILSTLFPPDQAKLEKNA